MCLPLIVVQLPDEHATEALGAALARMLARRAGDSTVVYFHGELGAGKTTCVRGLLRTLGVLGPIRSPTYTLVETYQTGELTCVHVDLYRVQGPLEVDELGLRDYFETACLLLVEWPEKGAGVLAPADLGVWLSYRGDARHGELRMISARETSWHSDLLNDASLMPYVTHLT